MNIQELGTASHDRLPVKVFILNNEYMCMVRQWQELTYESRYSNSYSDGLPDFVRLAEAYGWKGIRIEDPADLDAGIAAMLAHDGPVIVDCRVAKEANCLPMIPSGAAHTEMMLYGDRVEGTMDDERSEEHTSELQSLMRISYAVFCLKNTKENNKDNNT